MRAGLAVVARTGDLAPDSEAGEALEGQLEAVFQQREEVVWVGTPNGELDKAIMGEGAGKGQMACSALLLTLFRLASLAVLAVAWLLVFFPVEVLDSVTTRLGAESYANVLKFLTIVCLVIVKLLKLQG